MNSFDWEPDSDGMKLNLANLELNSVDLKPDSVDLKLNSKD
ncbi:hypothetical protein [Marinifilum fragile]|nr:hypothetical protein [Marinifilum fragile]